MTSGTFSERLGAAVDRVGSVACVGLDPVLEKLPREVHAGGAPNAADAGAAAGAIRRFCDGVIDAVRGQVGVVKFQSACFERYGEHGVAALRQSMVHARQAGLVVILDAKRGDIGISAEHYAAAAFGDGGADAITVSGYLGADTVRPFMLPGRGVFVLVRTSNPGSDEVQAARLADGRTVAEAMADTVARLGVGAVVGATKSAEGAALRARMPETMFLIPGYGAQGGGVEDVRPALRAGRKAGVPSSMGVLVTASRSVIYPGGAGEWRGNVGEAARKLVGELRGL